jgi:carboxymethylenebutenolidase
MPRIALAAHDGFTFGAWHEPAREARRGGIVIGHAIWGVTPHLIDLAGQFAEEGYEVLIPDLLARYDADGGFPAKNLDRTLYSAREAAAAATGWGGSCDRDIQTAVDWLRADGPVFLMGFCFGGTATWVAACRCEGVAAAACFYGGQITTYASETPRCPTILHFGKADELIPQHDVEAIAELHPDLPIHLYDAGHAFVAPSEYHADSARLAMLRTRALFHKASGAKEAGA